MKKYYTLLGFFLVAVTTHAQTLENTRWKSFYTAINDTVTVVVDTDTFRSNSSTGMNLVTSWISITNDSIFFADVSGSGTICPQTDTGLFTFTIQNDTLAFTPVYDSCMLRSAVLSSTPLWRDTLPPVGIDERALAEGLRLFPNPSHGTITVNAEVSMEMNVLDLKGRVLDRVMVVQGQNEISLALDPGFYIATFTTGRQEVVSRRLIIR